MKQKRMLPDDVLKSRQGGQGRRVTDSGWQRDFDDPIQLPDGDRWSHCMRRQPASLAYRKRTPQSRNGSPRLRR
jgi:hypothetical protein